MRLGIDFGTTRTVVAACDRGNYPVVSFEAPNGDSHEYWPSVVAEKGGEYCYGFAALEKSGKPDWTMVPSFKRWLAEPEATPNRRYAVGGTEVDMLSLLTGYLNALREALLVNSNLGLRRKNAELEVAVSVPANAFSTQRLVTLEAFRQAGFKVLRLLNEPSAAGVEYAHRYRNTMSSRREKVLVYDLGGGTFDISVVDMHDGAHDVVASRGLNQLGGDDFDDALLDLALSGAGIRRTDLPVSSLTELRLHCRDLKESIHPNTRRLQVELGRFLPTSTARRSEDLVQTLPIDQVEQAWTPLIEQTVELVRSLAPSVSDEADDLTQGLAGLYVVGGASALPAVARRLRSDYGRRVKRSPHPSAAVAIGLAIAAEEERAPALPQRLHHNLGVFREALSGRTIALDPIIAPGIELPRLGGSPLVLHRKYRAQHNVGHFRFIEFGWLGAGGEPRGDIKPFPDVLFPFDPGLRGQSSLREVPVRQSDQGATIEERYQIDASGAIELTILDTDSGYSEHFRIAG